ncbi:enoyl-CoA hydratase-related protein [Sphingomonas bacterium]|uniref:enoyl-CoA hydratase-related protein n=1 Tax=Sphingomonas bacterium TaxID=1895847 RepID=UPI001576C3C7|nr:enoyl-CoA hydratase-related protein [Sphingomonas bacterium]
MSGGLVDYTLEDGVAIVRLNDPATLNAMSDAMGAELREAVARAQGEARALLIGSHGRAFCSGANLSSGSFAMDDPDRDVGSGLEAVFNPLLLDLRNSAIPVLSAVRSAAAGVGCGLALAADLIVAGESAYFYQAFCHVGLSPDGGSSYLLARAIGRVRAMEMMLLGDKLTAAVALDWGLINRVVPDDQVDATALALAVRLARGPRSLGFIRAAAWAGADQPFAEALDSERVLQRHSGRTDDFAEGVAAFQHKRKPDFQGR